jgi:hypothetical protein
MNCLDHAALSSIFSVQSLTTTTRSRGGRSKVVERYMHKDVSKKAKPRVSPTTRVLFRFTLKRYAAPSPQLNLSHFSPQLRVTQGYKQNTRKITFQPANWTSAHHD